MSTLSPRALALRNRCAGLALRPEDWEVVAQAVEGMCIDAEMASGALISIHELLDNGGIPRGTFADDQVRNLVALYNQRGDEIERLRGARA